MLQRVVTEAISGCLYFVIYKVYEDTVIYLLYNNFYLIYTDNIFLEYMFLRYAMVNVIINAYIERT